jgi:hypothetical protein
MASRSSCRIDLAVWRMRARERSPFLPDGREVSMQRRIYAKRAATPFSSSPMSLPQRGHHRARRSWQRRPSSIQLFRRSGTFRDNQRASGRAMNDLERDAASTILAKCTSVEWDDRSHKTRISASIDTPVRRLRRRGRALF